MIRMTPRISTAEACPAAASPTKGSAAAEVQQLPQP